MFDVNFGTSNNINISLLYSKIAEDFCKYYYTKISNNSLQDVLPLFHNDVICTLNGEEFKGNINWLLKFTKHGVYKLQYLNIIGSSQPLNNTQILISVKGIVKGISLWGTSANWRNFNEIFVIENIGANKFIIKNYMFNIFKNS